MRRSGSGRKLDFANPDPDANGFLVYGQDVMRVALKRQELITGIVGPGGVDEMRLERIPAARLRKEPALLSDMIRVRAFFPGRRAVLVEEAGDAVTKAIVAALAAWRPGDAQIVVTAGALTKRSSLRKAFEADRTAYAAGVYDDPPAQGEIRDRLRLAGLRDIDGHAMSALSELAHRIDPGDLWHTISKLGLYKLGDDSPTTAEDVEACAPATSEVELGDLLDVVAEARTKDIGPLVQTLQGQGVTPVSLCIGVTRHFRALHAASCDPGGPGVGIAKLRPPVFGPRRDRMQRQARRWGLGRLERALGMLTDTDLRLRSANQNAPQMALVERTLIRLSMLASARG